MLITERRVPLPAETFSGPDEARRYDEHARRFMPPVYRHFAQQLVRGGLQSGRVLDIGTGSALLAMELVKTRGTDFRVVGLDLSPEMLQLAQRNLQGRTLGKRVELVLASASSFPFGEGAFDIVVSNSSLHSWKQPLEVFREIERTLRPDGLCLLRDNLRVPIVLNPALDFVGRWKGMNSAQRRLWRRAVEASYTLKEVRSMLASAGIKEAKVSLNPAFLDLEVTWSPQRVRKSV
jgi:ubiquinone/menaquinone biosynthesis C-methylase UbiE